MNSMIAARPSAAEPNSSHNIKPGPSSPVLGLWLRTGVAVGTAATVAMGAGAVVGAFATVAVGVGAGVGASANSANIERLVTVKEAEPFATMDVSVSSKPALQQSMVTVFPLYCVPIGTVKLRVPVKLWERAISLLRVIK